MPDYNEELTRKWEEKYSPSVIEEKKEENEYREGLKALSEEILPLTETTPDFNRIVTGDGYKEKVSTGFDGIDLALNGGLSPRLYLIAADTGRGKSTLAWNIAQNIARQTARTRAAYEALPEEERKETMPPKERSVLYFLLEMSAQELFARAISRRMLERNDGLPEKNVVLPLTEDQILYNFQNPDEVTDEQRAVFGIEEAKFIQAEAKYLYVIEGRKTVEEIETYIDAFQMKQRAIDYPPIVIVDYLQILAPTTDENGKQLIRDPRLQVDHNTTEFEKIKNSKGTPIIIISSVTKQGQGSLEVDITDLKESGQISFDVDCIITLNPTLTKEQEAILNKARTSDERAESKKKIKEKQMTEYPRKMTVRFEKNRGGIPNFKAGMLYFSAHYALFDDPENGQKTPPVYTGDQIRPPKRAPF